jgi:hypothetical protein
MDAGFSLKIGFLTFLTCLSSTSWALCTRGHPTVDQEAARSSEVIIGKVLGSKDVMSEDAPDIVGKTVYRVNIVNTFKGEKLSEVEITSDNTSSRFNMEKGKQYLLFVQTFDGESLVDSCGNSGELGERASTVKYLMHLNSPE